MNHSRVIICCNRATKVSNNPSAYKLKSGTSRLNTRVTWKGIVRVKIKFHATAMRRCHKIDNLNIEDE